MPQTLGYREMERSSVELSGSQVNGWVAYEELEASQQDKSFETTPPGPLSLDPNERYLINVWKKSDKPFTFDPCQDSPDVFIHVHTMSVREHTALVVAARSRLATRLKAADRLDHSPISPDLWNKKWGPSENR